MSWDFIVSALAKQVGEEGMKTIGTEAAKTVAKQGLKLTAEETAKLVAKETAKKAAWEVTKKGGEKFVQGQLTKKATEATMAAVTPGDEESLTKYGANDLFSLLLIFTNTFLQINSENLFLKRTPGNNSVSVKI